MFQHYNEVKWEFINRKLWNFCQEVVYPIIQYNSKKFSWGSFPYTQLMFGPERWPWITITSEFLSFDSDKCIGAMIFSLWYPSVYIDWWDQIYADHRYQARKENPVRLNVWQDRTKMKDVHGTTHSWTFSVSSIS